MSSLVMAQTSRSKSDPKPAPNLKSTSKSVSKSNPKISNPQFNLKSNPKPKSKPPPTWSMFPSLHEDVSRLLSAEDREFTFHGVDDSTDCVRQYDTCVMGIFRCYSRQCGSRIWSSKKVPITIREYSGNEYNARVYHQRCQECNKLSRPKLDDSYAERVAYRLLKWSGVEQEQPIFNGEANGPHLSDLCEGCRAGHCAEGNRNGGLGGLATRFGNFML
ncbi:hypothetical protein VTL71DRAFT_2066 [Oculimacula yallundae]|uniref:3CxxC-type domain-containing protein n=1 Tax=Oculimacula yallundae TaxID=86028 RepID=A0ABR4C8C4_9HELO